MNIKRIELLAVVSVAIATIAIAASMMDPQKAGAHTSDLGFKWFNNGYDYENVEIYGISNSWDVSSGLWDWYWNSLLWVNSASGFKEITYQEGDFGTTAPLGRAQVTPIRGRV